MESKNVHVKARALTKQETKYLVTLIESSKIINSTCTNAAANKVKNEEWDRLTDQFNESLSPNDHRTHQQLRSKWENLKRSAKKRNAVIEENQSRLANGKEAELIPPDDILDRVSILLEGTIEGFTDKFGGDSVPLEPKFMTERVHIKEELVHESVLTESMRSDCHIEESSGDGMEGNGLSKRQKRNDSRRVRNLAIAEYYAAKTRLVDAFIQNVCLENDKLKLEISEYKKIIGKINK